MTHKCRWKEEDAELIGTDHQLGAILLQGSPGGFGQIGAVETRTEKGLSQSGVSVRVSCTQLREHGSKNL